MNDPSFESTGPATHPCRTLAELDRVIDTWRDFTPETKAVLHSAVRTIAWFALTSEARAAGRVDRISRGDVPLTAIPADPQWLAQKISPQARRWCGLTRRAANNAASSFRRVARRAGLIAPIRAVPPTSRETQELLKQLGDQPFVRRPLLRFLRYIDDQNVPIAAVTTQTLVEFQRFSDRHLLHLGRPDFVKRVAHAWNRASELLPTWPQTRLVAPGARISTFPPLASYSFAFREQFAAFELFLANGSTGGLFDGDARRLPMRPSSVRLRLYNALQAASVLAILGHDRQ